MHNISGTEEIATVAGSKNATHFATLKREAKGGTAIIKTVNFSVRERYTHKLS